MYKLFLIIAIFFAGFSVNIDDSYAKERRSKAEVKEIEKRKIDMLIQHLGSVHYNNVEVAIHSFEIMKEDSIPYLVSVIVDRSYSRRTHLNAIYALGRLGPIAKRAIQPIMIYLRKDDEEFKAVSVIALGKIGKPAKSMALEIAQLMFDDSPWVSKSARTALLNIGTPAAKESVAEFDELQKKIDELESGK